MAYPIITLIFAAILAFMAYRSSSLETGSEVAAATEGTEEVEAADPPAGGSEE